MCYWKKIIISTFCCLLMLNLFSVANGYTQRDKREKEPKVIVREPKNSPPPSNRDRDRDRDRDRPSNRDRDRDRDRPPRNR